MSTTEQSIDVNVPVSTAYNQWTQFEDFPQFMENVERVHQIDETHLHWTAKIAGQTRQWDAEITEQIPDERVAWRSLSGATNAGVVTFHRLSDSTTRVMLQMETEPEGVIEKVGEVVGSSGRAARRDLERFKEFIESRGMETGAWRGSVDRPGIG